MKCNLVELPGSVFFCCRLTYRNLLCGVNCLSCIFFGSKKKDGSFCVLYIRIIGMLPANLLSTQGIFWY